MHPAFLTQKTVALNLKKHAQKMVGRTNKNLKGVEIGHCVTVPVSQFDKGCGDPNNVIGIILAKKDGNYQIGTRGGVIDRWMPRNAFEAVTFRGLGEEDVPKFTLSIREIVRKLSIGNGQGFVRCSCKSSKCRTPRCGSQFYLVLHSLTFTVRGLVSSHSPHFTEWSVFNSFHV